ncbi:MAG: replication initiator protein A [Bdellovibrionota bacterium]|jgi:hypothetical protein
MSKRQIEFFETSQKRESALHNHRRSHDEGLGEGESTWFTAPVVVKPALNSNRLSRDEMNLAEFPLSVLSTRVSPGKKTLEFEDSVLDKNGHPVKRQWIITAADKFGLPTASDDEVLLGLLKISVDRGLNERKVYFTRYELLKTLNWSTEGRSYKRLTNALDRLSGVRIKASNSFYDNESKAFSTRNFGIIDEYEINSGKTQNPKPSFFVWSEVLHKSFSSGFIKKLDFDFFLSLESAVSKRLYRFLDKHFWYRARFQMNLFTLAHEKIGVSRTYRYPSSLRQQIDPAVEELVKAGFLSHVEYQGRGQATEIVFFAAPDHGRRSEKPKKSFTENREDPPKDVLFQRMHSTTSNSTRIPRDAEGFRDTSYNSNHIIPQEGENRGTSSLEAQMYEDVCERGVHPTQANRLIRGIFEAGDEQRAIEIIRHFDHLVSEGSPRVSRNAPGFLFRALEKPQEFALPQENVRGRHSWKEGREDSHRANSNQQANYSKKTLVSQNGGDTDLALQTEYLKERKREIARLRGEVEPSILEKLEGEVRIALEKIKGLVTESGFEETVQHGIDEKIAKLCVVPSFDEWLRTRKK